MSATRILRLPPLTVEQASVLLDVLDALTNSVVQAYGEEIVAFERRPPEPGDYEDEEGDERAAGR